jgi:hypothetical protein
MNLLILLGAAQRAKAKAPLEMLEFGEQLDKLVSKDVGETRFTLNGVSFRVSSGSTKTALQSLLDHFQDRCSQWSELDLSSRDPSSDVVSAKSVSAKREPGLSRHGVLRLEQDDRGVVACFDTQGKSFDAGWIMDNALHFAKTGDLGIFGTIHYFMVRKAENGASTYLSVSTEGPVNLLRMFPSTGDAPGIDPIGIPRPVESRRRLVIAESAHGLGLTSYSVRSLGDSTLWAYRAELSKLAWQLTDVESDSRMLAFIAQRGDRCVLIAAQEVEGELWVNIVDFERS